jgi:hypothetical protein
LAEYIVYEPRYAAADPIERAEHLVFVKDGFRWWAAIVPALWLMVKGLWLEFALCVLVIVGLTWGLETAGANDSVASTLLLIAQLVFGFEASTIESAALERRGWRSVGWIEGRNRDEAERRFFTEWLPAQHQMPLALHDGSPPSGPLASLTSAAIKGARDAADRWRQRYSAKA